MKIEVNKMPSYLLFYQTSSGVEEKFFKSLKELIRHYKQKNQGLATHLCRSLKIKTFQEQPRQCAEPVVPDEDNDYESEYELKWSIDSNVTFT